MTFAQLCLKKKALPTMLMRFCCAVLKETKGANTVTLTGVRRQESVQRSHRNEAELVTRRKNGKFTGTLEQLDQFTRSKEVEGVQCVRGNDKIVINPIIDWVEADVWYFLNEVVHANHCELYDRGWKRIGCLFCPMASQKEIVMQGGGISKIQSPDFTNYPQATRKRLHEQVQRPNRRRNFRVVDKQREYAKMVLRPQSTNAVV